MLYSKLPSYPSLGWAAYAKILGSHSTSLKALWNFCSFPSEVDLKLASSNDPPTLASHVFRLPWAPLCLVEASIFTSTSASTGSYLLCRWDNEQWQCLINFFFVISISLISPICQMITQILIFSKINKSPIWLSAEIKINKTAFSSGQWDPFLTSQAWHWGNTQHQHHALPEFFALNTTLHNPCISPTLSPQDTKEALMAFLIFVRSVPFLLLESLSLISFNLIYSSYTKETIL